MGLSGFGELRSGEGKGGGGPAHGGAMPNGVLGSGKAYVPRELVQKKLEGGAGAHRGFWWPETSRRLVAGGVWRRKRCCGRDGVVRGCSETADSPGRHEWTLRR